MMKIKTTGLPVVFKGSCECFMLSRALQLRLFYVNCFICTLFLFDLCEQNK